MLIYICKPPVSDGYGWDTTLESLQTLQEKETEYMEEKCTGIKMVARGEWHRTDNLQGVH